MHFGVVGTILAERRGRADRERHSVRDVLERQRVLAKVSRVGEPANSEVVSVVGQQVVADRIGRQRIDAIVIGVCGRQRVRLANGHEHGAEVAPALAHAASLRVRQPRRIADEPVADVVAPLVRDDLVVERAVAVERGRPQHAHIHADAELRLEDVAVGLRDRQRGDDDRGVGAAHSNDAQRVVRDDDADRAVQLGVLDLYDEAARATVDQGNLARDSGDVDERGRAAIARGGDAIVHQHDIPRNVKRLGTERRGPDGVASGDYGRAIDRHRGR